MRPFVISSCVLLFVFCVLFFPSLRFGGGTMTGSCAVGTGAACWGGGWAMGISWRSGTISCHCSGISMVIPVEAAMLWYVSSMIVPIWCCGKQA